MVPLGRQKEGRTVMGNRSARIIAAGLISIIVAALATGVFYVLLVMASFFIAMPREVQSWAWVGGLLGIVFTITLTMAFRKISNKFTF